MSAGLVRFGYVHFAFLGNESLWTGEASECAADQDMFWEYHDYIFTQQAGENRGTFNKENLKRFAAELDLDIIAFDECIDAGKYTQLVQQETAWARSLGVQSTPTFIANGAPIIGSQPFEVFQQVFDAELNQ